MTGEKMSATILVVDDETVHLKLYGEALGDLGFSVMMGSEPLAALQLARNNGIDLLITDYAMPDMNGLELAAAFRKIQPRTPIIMMTAHADLGTYLRARNAGIFEYLSKPFRLSELKRVIESALKESSAQAPGSSARPRADSANQAKPDDWSKRRCMSAEWSEDLSIGVPVLDRQHRELFKQIDTLLKAWAGGRGLVEVQSIIEFLEQYVSDHFGTEERYMVAYTYPNSPEHMAQHEVFKNNFDKLKTQYYQHGADDDLIAETNDLIVDWFREHIRCVDRAFGLFLKTKMHTRRTA